MRIVENLHGNQFIPPETLEQFLSKKGVGFRPGKRIFYEKQPGRDEKREMLNEYLRDI